MSVAQRTDRPMKPEEWGFPGWLTPDQQKALDAFSAQLLKEGVFTPKTLMPSQHLLRFLRARDFDVVKTMIMLKDDLEWRRQFEGVTFRRNDFPAIFNFFIGGALYRAGFDVDGRPVLVANLCRLFPREVTDVGEIPKFWVSYVHELARQCDVNGKTDYTIVADLAKFSPSQNFSLVFVKILIDILQKYYPERLAYALVIHTPMTFRMLWNMIAPFLEERTKAKVHLLGNDLMALQKYIPKDQLEVVLGGTHAPYPLPDEIAQKLDSEAGITVNTGLFDGEAPKQTATATAATEEDKVTPLVSAAKPQMKKSGSMGGARLRTLLMGRRKSEKKLASPEHEEDLVTSMEVPKTLPRITVFGASGRTGQLVVKKALDAGFDVCAFIRLESSIPGQFLGYQEKFGKDKLQLVRGDILEPNDLDRAIETSDAVISVVGAPPSLSADSEFFLETSEAIVDSMQRNGSKRLIVVSAAQANRMSVAWYDANASMLENGNRVMYWQSHYKHLAQMEKFIENHTFGLDFTFIRPVQLDDDLKNSSEAYQVEANTFFMGAGASKTPLSRPALAAFIMQECVLKKKFLKQGVAIAAQ